LTGILSGIMLGKQDDKKPEAPLPPPLEVSPSDLVPEPVAEVAPLVVAGAVGAAAAVAVDAATDNDEDEIA
jgi:hypothetical protein